MTDLATIATDGPIVTLTLNRPDARNALSLELLTALHQRLDAITADASRAGAHAPKVLVLVGAGKSFCAGMDLKQVLDVPGAPARLLGSLAELCLKIRALPLVTIAVVQGAAIGGGCGLATVADLSITHDDAKLGFPEVDLGICPAVVSPWLVRKIGAGPARAVLLRGGLMSGREAHALGIITDCADSRDALEPAASALARKIASGGGNALRAAKALLNELDGSLDAALSARAAAISASVLNPEETRAAMAARQSA